MSERGRPAFELPTYCLGVGAMALFVFFAGAAWAWVVAADFVAGAAWGVAVGVGRG